MPGLSDTPSKSSITGKAIVGVADAVKDESGRVLGGVGMAYAIDGLMANYIEGIKLGKTGHAFIVSPTGVMIGHPDASLVLQNVGQSAGIAPILGAPSGVMTYVRNGVEKTQAWATVPGWNWKVAITMPPYVATLPVGYAEAAGGASAQAVYAGDDADHRGAFLYGVLDQKDFFDSKR